MENNPLTVAIVDDSLIIRESARFRLTLLGYNVVMEAENGQEFLNKLENDAVPDICLLDINMPIMDGIETARNLRKKWPLIKILFHTLENKNAYIQNDAHLAQCGYISKDASSQDFKNALLNIQRLTA